MLDTRALSEAYRRFQRPLLNHVRGRIADPEIAADLVQEIFLKAHRCRHLYRPEHALSTWLWAIAKGLVLDHLRGIRVRPSSIGFGFGSDGEDQSSIEEIPSLHPDAERVLLTKDRRRQAFKLLRPLTRSQRRVFCLRAFRHL